MGVRGRVKSSKDWLPRRNPVSIPRLNRRSGPIASMYGIIERGQRTKNSLFPVLSRKKRRRGGAKRLTCQRYEVSRLIRRGERAFSAGARERTSVFPLLVGGPVVPMPPRFPVLFF